MASQITDSKVNKRAFGRTPTSRVCHPPPATILAAVSTPIRPEPQDVQRVRPASLVSSAKWIAPRIRGSQNLSDWSIERPLGRGAVDMANETIRIGQIEISFLLEATDTNGSLAMFEFLVPVGAKVPLPHFHKHYDETIYGLEGVITFTVDERIVHIAPGESCFIPRGAVHGFNNLKERDAKALAVVTPALIGSDFFRETAAVINTSGPPDLEKLKAVLAKHGLVPVTPQVAPR